MVATAHNAFNVMNKRRVPQETFVPTVNAFHNSITGRPAQLLRSAKVAIAGMATAATVGIAVIETNIALVYSTPQPNVIQIRNVEVTEHGASVRIIAVPATKYPMTVPVHKR